MKTIILTIAILAVIIIQGTHCLKRTRQRGRNVGSYYYKGETYQGLIDVLRNRPDKFKTWSPPECQARKCVGEGAWVPRALFKNMGPTPKTPLNPLCHRCCKNLDIKTNLRKPFGLCIKDVVSESLECNCKVLIQHSRPG